MKKLFKAHLSQIKSYEEAGPMAKNLLLEKTKKSLEKLLSEKGNLSHTLQKMTYAACLINYANAELVIENECLTMNPELLVETLAGYYNQLECNRLQDLLKETVSINREFPDRNGLKILQIEFMRIINTPTKDNTVLLKQLLHTIDHWVPNGTTVEQKKQVDFLNALRRRFLIKPLEEAVGIESSQKIVDIHAASNDTNPSAFIPVLSNYKASSSKHLLQEFIKHASHAKQQTFEYKQELEAIVTMMIADIEKTQQDLLHMTNLHLDALNGALTKLNTQKEAYKNNDRLKKLVQLLDKLEKQIKSLASSDQEDIDQLREVAENTYNLLTSKGSVDNISFYDNYAKGLQQGKSSPGLSALGATMLVLSVTFIALGLAVMLSPLVAGVAAATTLAASITFFVTSSQKGLSKTTNDLVDFVEANPEAHQPSL